MHAALRTRATVPTVSFQRNSGFQTLMAGRKQGPLKTSSRMGWNLWDRKEQKGQMEICLEMTTPISGRKYNASRGKIYIFLFLKMACKPAIYKGKFRI